MNFKGNLCSGCKCGLALLLVAWSFAIPTEAQDVRPVIRYANTMGGSGSDGVSAIAVDSVGFIYITGLTTSTDFPSATRLSASTLSPSAGSQGAAFVTKIDPSGESVI